MSHDQYPRGERTQIEVVVDEQLRVTGRSLAELEQAGTVTSSEDPEQYVPTLPEIKRFTANRFTPDIKDIREIAVRYGDYTTHEGPIRPISIKRVSHRVTDAARTSTMHVNEFSYTRRGDEYGPYITQKTGIGRFPYTQDLLLEAVSLTRRLDASRDLANGVILLRPSQLTQELGAEKGKFASLFVPQSINEASLLCVDDHPVRTFSRGELNEFGIQILSFVNIPEGTTFTTQIGDHGIKIFMGKTINHLVEDMFNPKKSALTYDDVREF